MIPSKAVLALGAVIAAAIISWYLYRFRRGKKYVLEEGIRIILSSVSIPAGCKIMYYSFVASDLKELDSDRTFILIGGFALTWISIASVFRVFSARRDEH